jgi:methylglutaconyl-CoA hydratase
MLNTSTDAQAVDRAGVHGAALRRRHGPGRPPATSLSPAQPKAQFCLSEVKLGLIAATISPYVVQADGRARMRAATSSPREVHRRRPRRYRLGFVHELVPPDGTGCRASTRCSATCSHGAPSGAARVQAPDQRCGAGARSTMR